MRLLSSIIKSSQVIEGKSNYSQNVLDSTKKINEAKLNAAKEYEDIIIKAKEEAEKIISEAEKNTEKFLEETYLKSKAILDESKERGFNEGYDIGYNEGKKVSDELIEEANEIKRDYLKEKDRVLKSIENDVIDLVLTISEKIIYQKLEDDKEVIISIILKGLDSLNARDKVIIRVAKEDYDIIELSKKRLLAMASLIEDIEVKIDNKLVRGNCIVETSKGNVDVSIDSQLEEMKTIVNMLLNRE